LGVAPRKKSASSEKDFLTPERRAEDILLGALGFGEEARIIKVQGAEAGFSGIGEWPDGEQFAFESEEPPTELELWALSVLIAKV